MTLVNSVVAGIMVLVSLRELLPTALKYMTAEVRTNNSNKKTVELTVK